MKYINNKKLKTHGILNTTQANTTHENINETSHEHIKQNTQQTNA